MAKEEILRLLLAGSIPAMSTIYGHSLITLFDFPWCLYNIRWR